MARVTLPESKIKTRRKRRRIIFIASLLAIVVCVGAGFAWLSQASVVRIARVDVQGTQTVASSTIVSYVRSKLDGDYLFLIPKNNIFFYPKGQIASGLLAALPTLASVSVNAENFNTISITVVERQPKALWCGTDATNPVPCFLLDGGGVAYGAALTFADDTYTKYYGALTGSTTPKQYLIPAEFRSLSALVDTIAENQSRRSEVGTPTEASGKTNSIASVWVDENKDVHLAFASGFTLLFTLSADGGDVYQRFTLALQSDPFKQHQLSDFQYLDLRFGDKLYYKLK